MSYDTVRRWKKEFESGVESIKNALKSGRPNLHLVKKSCLRVGDLWFKVVICGKYINLNKITKN